MHWQIEELLKVGQDKKREAAATAVLEDWERSHPENFPCGYVEIRCCDKLGDVRRRFDDYAAYCFEFYDDFTRLYRKEHAPDVLFRQKERCVRNIVHMNRILSMPTDQRKRLDVHQKFPLFDEFPRLLDNALCVGGFDVSGIECRPQVVNRGGFATIYLVQDKEGQSYALKVLRDYDDPIEKHRRSPIVKQFVKNVYENRDLLSDAPFTRLRAMSNPEMPGPNPWWLMDFFDGTDVETALSKDHCFMRDDALVGIILGTPAGMIEKVHNRSLVVHDNNWRSVLFRDGVARMCDFDAISLPEHAAPRLKSLEYSSQEQLLTVTPTFTGDLEGFALMLDYFFTQKHLITEDNKVSHKRCAEKNVRKYDSRRQRRLPPHIRDVVTPLLTYPRDDSLKASDFVSAIQADYKI